VRGALPAALVTAVLVGLPAGPAAARVEPVAPIDPVVPLDPFATQPEGCIVPAVLASREPCAPLHSPRPDRASACNLPVIYLGGRPGPCPPQQEPPESRIVPLVPSDLSR
jgi:hypothetical protein